MRQVECVGSPKGEEIGGHRAVKVRQAAMIAAGTRGSSMDKARETGGGIRKKQKVDKEMERERERDKQRQRQSERQRQRDRDRESRRKSTEKSIIVRQRGSTT